jgi:AcrR family transcriptional regulator
LSESSLIRYGARVPPSLPRRGPTATDRLTVPRRAPALPADERRAALIEATLPLVLAQGTDISTRQIAEAAGVAEGTIFRVFTTKDDLIDAVVSSAFDPTSAIDGLQRIDRSADLRTRLVAAVLLLQERVDRISDLLHAIGGRGRPGPHGPAPDARWAAQEAMITDALALLIEPDRDQLRCGPQEAARRLRLISLAMGHPRLTGGQPLAPSEVVSMFLDGLRAGAGTPPAGPPAPRLTTEVPSC